MMIATACQACLEKLCVFSVYLSGFPEEKNCDVIFRRHWDLYLLHRMFPQLMRTTLNVSNLAPLRPPAGDLTAGPQGMS